MPVRPRVPRYRIASLQALDPHALDAFVLFGAGGAVASLTVEYLVEPAAIAWAVDTATLSAAPRTDPYTTRG